MKNKELARIQKMLKIINENNEINLKEIRDIRIEKFENEAIVELIGNGVSTKNFTVLRKDFEARYSIGWEEQNE